MILDSSAVVAIFCEEPGHEVLLAKLGAAETVGIGAPSLAETAIVLSARLGTDARGLLARFLAEGGVTIVPWNDAHYAAALEGWLRFGKGRHPAALNFGDCLSYGLARASNQPLLACGDDFPKTDLRLA